ncbi:hypothetical protein K0U27_11165 [archaeon]|nr:hypothetical protein [archaeon]
MESVVNELNKALTKSFSHAMISIKPTNPRSETYSKNLRRWQKSFQFPKEVKEYFESFHNRLALAGGVNSSEGPNDATAEFQDILKKVIEAEEYIEELSKLIPAKIDYIDDKRLEEWKSEFYYPKKIKEFIQTLQKTIGINDRISAKTYEKLLRRLLDELESEYNSEKLLKRLDSSVGMQKYVEDETEIQNQAESEKEEIMEKISKNPKYSELNEPTKEIIKISVKKFKENEIKVKAEKKILGKKYTEFQNNVKKKDNLDEAIKTGAAKVKRYPKVMDAIAGTGIVGILALMLLSITCFGCGEEGFLQQNQELKNKIGPITDIAEDSTIFDPNENLASKEETTVFDPSGKIISKETTKSATSEQVISNPYREILESNVMYVLISTIVAPVSARILKEKFDIDIDEKQINMIMADGIKAVSMYSKEADKLRDKNGHIPRKYQKVLRNKAFKALKENYDDKKYTDLTAKIGSEVFEKAIENGVIKNKIGDMALRKEHVEGLIKQGINAYPGIVEWKDWDERAKMAFINGNIRKALKNTGAEGWSYRALEEMFDSEATKRILAVKIMAQGKLIENLDADNPYIKYTSDFAETIGTTLGKRPE